MKFQMSELERLKDPKATVMANLKWALKIQPGESEASFERRKQHACRELLKGNHFDTGASNRSARKV